MKLYVIAAAMLCCLTAFAGNGSPQQEQPDTLISAEMSKVLDACLALGEAASANDVEALRNAADSLQSCNVSKFMGFDGPGTSDPSLKGHPVFNVAFAESLAAGENAYDKADTLNRVYKVRGQRSDGKIFTITCFAEAGCSTVRSFKTQGHQELTVAAEYGGLISLKVKVSNNSGYEKHYDDIKDVKEGRKYRKVVFDTFKGEVNDVTLEIINCCDRDISFVIISN